MTEIEPSQIFEIALRTLAVCLPALAIAVVIGLPVGILLGRSRFRGRGFVVSAVNAGMGMPPVVVGLAGALLFWRNGPLGFLQIMYSVDVMVIVQVVLALPFIIAITLAAVASLDEDWALQVRTLGIPPLWRLWLLLREIRLGLVAAVIAGLGGILSEVGAVLMVGGNLEGETRVFTTSILMHTQMGEYEIAIAFALMLVGLTFTLSALLTVVQQGGRS